MYEGRSSSENAPEPSSPQYSIRSSTENKLADNVTTISRQLLDSFAFSQVDNLIGDLAHMREYLVSKLPDPQDLPLLVAGEVRAAATVEYKGAIYGRRCLSAQTLILEYLLGRCLQQCQACLDEIAETQAAARKIEATTEDVVRHAQQRGVRVDVVALDAESAGLFKRVRGDLYELAEEMRCLDGSREVAEAFLRNPASVLCRPAAVFQVRAAELC